MKTGDKRRSIFVDREVQVALLRQLVCYWLCGLSTVLFLAIIYRIAPLWMAGSSRASASLSLQREVVPLLIASLVVLPMIILSALRFSHRFVGPMLRIRGALQQLANGDSVAPLEFREDDFWRDAAGDFNRLLHRMQDGN